jgi:hypothetical protein
VFQVRRPCIVDVAVVVYRRGGVQSTIHVISSNASGVYAETTKQTKKQQKTREHGGRYVVGIDINEE